MDISYISLILFIIITLLYISSMPVIGKPLLKLNPDGMLTDNDLLNYYSECMPKLAIYLLFIVVTQFGLNIAYLIDKCKGNAAKNIGAAALFTFIPWVLIFGVMIAVIIIFPGFKMAFSNVIGYFVVSGRTNELLSKILIDTDINLAIEKTADPTKKTELMLAAEAIMKICGNKSILINQIYPDNFDSIWNVLKPLLRDPSTYSDREVKQELLDLVVLRDNVGEALWYIYTAILVSSIVYYNLATRGCIKDPNAVKAEYDEYLKKQEEADQQAAVNNSTVYTVS
jgi:hypothetical protein